MNSSHNDYHDDLDDDDTDDTGEWFSDPIEVPITDELDLHTFRPEEVKDLLNDYFEACLEKGITSVRIIHGKGKGILKKRVQSILASHRLVERSTDAPPEAGGWGATRVWLRKGGDSSQTHDKD